MGWPTFICSFWKSELICFGSIPGAHHRLREPINASAVSIYFKGPFFNIHVCTHIYTPRMQITCKTCKHKNEETCKTKLGLALHKLSREKIEEAICSLLASIGHCPLLSSLAFIPCNSFQTKLDNPLAFHTPQDNVKNNCNKQFFFVFFLVFFFKSFDLMQWITGVFVCSLFLLPRKSKVQTKEVKFIKDTGRKGKKRKEEGPKP